MLPCQQGITFESKYIQIFMKTYFTEIKCALYILGIIGIIFCKVQSKKSKYVPSSF